MHFSEWTNNLNQNNFTMKEYVKFQTLAAAFCFFLITGHRVMAQKVDFTHIPARVDFSDKKQIWDGFGVNYVETSQTFYYNDWPQDYGGFYFLNDDSKEEIIDLFFGENGLQPDIVKMFLDPLHQKEEGGPYDHKTTTANMRHFVKKGLELSRKRGQDLSIITTLYGPPGFMTLQKQIRGRDLDPAYHDQLAHYLLDWVRFLREEEKLPLDYVSLHNEGESWLRWPIESGLEDIDATGHDYNMFWSPELVNDILIRTRKLFDEKGFAHVKLTNGEPTNWFRFGAWGYDTELARNPKALDALGLITSHGFYVGNMEAARWYGPHSNRANTTLRNAKPELHSWTTSSAWCIKNDRLVVDNEIVRRYIVNAYFIKEIFSNIYEAQVNGYIPWAALQIASQWIRPDPNPGTAIRIFDDGTWEIRKGYYYYKQVTSAGRKGMHVVHTSSMDSQINIIGFSGANTPHPDAFVIANTGTTEMAIRFDIRNSRQTSFQAFRTSGDDIYQFSEKPEYTDQADNYTDIGIFTLEGNSLIYKAPANSVTTFRGL
jgi:hypothetical protein